ncbi:MAG TPA: hypothetical protein ENG52_00770 [Nitrososphaeria archaeon]|nr:hypothetical protein [Nitrososphaeria archaeon]
MFYLLAIALSSLALAISAISLAIKRSRSPEKNLSETHPSGGFEPGIRTRPVRRVNSLAEAAVILGARSLMLFDQQGFVIEAYNVSKEYGAETAAIMAELINMLKRLGLPASTVTFNDLKSFVIELEKVSDMRLYGLVIGGGAALKDAGYAKGVLQRYLESIVERRW